MQTYIGEIRPFAFGATPSNWLPCDGRILPIASNQVLFQLLGIRYGGDGQTTFGLPNLQGRAPLGSGTSPGGATYGLGDTGGVEQHVLSIPETPQHTHTVGVSSSTSGSQPMPSSDTVLGMGLSDTGKALNVYGSGSAMGALAAQTVAEQGGDAGHENRMPYLALNYCIAVQGLFPSPS